MFTIASVPLGTLLHEPTLGVGKAGGLLSNPRGTNEPSDHSSLRSASLLVVGCPSRMLVGAHTLALCRTLR